jgi:hypothetical protein
VQRQAAHVRLLELAARPDRRACGGPRTSAGAGRAHVVFLPCGLTPANGSGRPDGNA